MGASPTWEGHGYATAKDAGCGSDREFRTNCTLKCKDHSIVKGLVIEFSIKGVFIKKGGLKIKRVGHKNHCQL